MAERAPSYIPEGMNTVTTHLWFNGDCRKALDAYQKIIGAELVGEVIPWPDGEKVMHAMIKIGDTNIMVADAWPGRYEHGPTKGASASLWCYVEDCDAYYNRAVNAGWEVVDEMMDAFWGDRSGKVKDPFGHCWSFSTFKWIYTPEEMQQKQQEWQTAAQI